MRRSETLVVALLLIMNSVPAARATWSIILIDTETREIAVGAATCVTEIDLRFHLPVVRIATGAGCAQSFVEPGGQNRLLIWNELLRGTAPATILQLLAARDPQHQTRQYGIVDVLGRAVAFSGSQNGAYANGITGQIGTIAYAIQGNVITGQPVLDMARLAVQNTPGGLPEKLMAAMEAARLMGGDGRCSCAPGDPTGCGSPPPMFTKSAHVGFMLDARLGDTSGSCPTPLGCASGNYYMALNVPGRGVADPDPVITLRAMFDVFRAGVVGVPDAVESLITITPRRLPPGGPTVATMRIEVRDWQGLPASGVTSVAVSHSSGSAGSSTIGPVNPLGGGVYECALTVGTTTGLDRFSVRVFYGAGLSRFLMRPATLRILARGDMDGDGLIGNFDIDPFVLALTDPAAYQQQYPDLPPASMGDVNLDGRFDAFDIAPFVDCLNQGACP